MKKQFILFFSFILLSLFSCSDNALGSSSDNDNTDNTDDTEVKKGFESLTADNHPRLLMNSDDFEALKENIKTNTTLSALHKEIMKVCDNEGMNDKKLEFALDASGTRLLFVSRDAMLRILTCSYAYRITGDKKYLTKAEKDINDVCDFQHWNPSHFLDVAEMAVGVAIGYDWLYNDLSENTKKKVQQKLMEYALKPVLDANFSQWWYNGTNNWNQVCNAGMACAALAVYEHYPSECKSVIEKSAQTNKPAMEAMYSPYGNYVEGGSYWNFGTSFQILLLSLLDSTLGTDYDLSKIDGFEETAEYMLYMVGIDNRLFNYSDCDPYSVATLPMWWFADKFKNPSLLYNEVRALKEGKYTASSFQEKRLLPIIMAYANKIDMNGITPPKNKIWYAGGKSPVVLIHTDWSYTESDKYLGIKGGRANVSHGHMDAGSFVYDAYGVRWSMDFGMQNYSFTENVLKKLGGDLWDMSQNSWRWKLFRYNNLNHSTISINDSYYLVGEMATLENVFKSDNELGGVINLTSVVKNEAKDLRRTVKLVDQEDLVVIDELKARDDKDAKVRWCMATMAVPEIKDGFIQLTAKGKTMYLKADQDVEYKIWSTSTGMEYDYDNPGTYLCGFETVVNKSGSVTFTTTLSPDLNQ